MLKGKQLHLLVLAVLLIMGTSAGTIADWVNASERTRLILIVALEVPAAVYAFWLVVISNYFPYYPPADISERIKKAEARLQSEPEKAAPAWTVAQARMEEYFGRNLRQANLIFTISVAAMVTGFGRVAHSSPPLA